MSGDSLRVMTLRAVSSATVVLNGGNSARLCQPSSNPTRASASKRPLALDCAPRPRRRSRSIATASSGKEVVTPAGSEGAVAGGGLGACEDARLMKGNITCRENKSRTTSTPSTIVRGIFVSPRVVCVCLKKPQRSGCFECDKVITVQRFPTFEPLKPHAECHHSDRGRRTARRRHFGGAGAGRGRGRGARGAAGRSR